MQFAFGSGHSGDSLKVCNVFYTRVEDKSNEYKGMRVGGVLNKGRSCPNADSNWNECIILDLRFYIYASCGHSTFGPKPLIECCNASFPPDGSFSTLCQFTAHPFQSWKINTLCPECSQRRKMLMDRIEISQVVKFDDWRWKVSYGMPTHGKDFWGRKADERAELEAKTGRRTKKTLRFSWRSKQRDATKMAAPA